MWIHFAIVILPGHKSQVRKLPPFLHKFLGLYTLLYVLVSFYIAVINTRTRSNLGKKRIIWLTHPNHSPSLRGAKQEVKQDRNLEVGAEA